MSTIASLEMSTDDFLNEIISLGLLKTEKGYTSSGLANMQFDSVKPVVSELISLGLTRKLIFDFLIAKNLILKHFRLDQFYKWFSKNQDKLLQNNSSVNFGGVGLNAPIVSASIKEEKKKSDFTVEANPISPPIPATNIAPTVTTSATDNSSGSISALEKYRAKIAQEKAKNTVTTQDNKNRKLVGKYIEEYKPQHVVGSLYLNSNGEDIYIESDDASIDASLLKHLEWDSPLNPYKNLDFLKQKPFRFNMYEGCNWLHYNPNDPASPVYIVVGTKGYPILKDLAPLKQFNNHFERFYSPVTTDAISWDRLLDNILKELIQFRHLKNVQRINFKMENL